MFFFISFFFTYGILMALSMNVTKAYFMSKACSSLATILIASSTVKLILKKEENINKL